MAIKYNGHDLQKRIINGQEVKKVMYNGNQIRPSVTPVNDYLRFTAVNDFVYWACEKVGSPNSVQLHVSWDTIDWIDYDWGDAIYIAEGNTLYVKNKSTTVTGFSTSDNDYYHFIAGIDPQHSTGRLRVDGDVNYLLCSNSTQNLVSNLHEYAFHNLFASVTGFITAPKLPSNYAPSYCYSRMFSYCRGLTTPPELPATVLSEGCYEYMFTGAFELQQLSSLPATFIPKKGYHQMFAYINNIKISETQTGDYQTPYRIPIAGTGSVEDTTSLQDMFRYTGGTFTGTPSINTTYYTSNQVI